MEKHTIEDAKKTANELVKRLVGGSVNRTKALNETHYVIDVRCKNKKGRIEHLLVKVDKKTGYGVEVYLKEE